MKIIIEKIVLDVHNNIFVHFSSNYGKGAALWKDDLPILHKEYCVEADIENVLIWGQDIVEDMSRGCSVQIQDDDIWFAGILDSIEDDGYTVLKLGESIVPFISKGIPMVVGSSIKLKTKFLILTPILEP